jgi:hypothetical protein
VECLDAREGGTDESEVDPGDCLLLHAVSYPEFQPRRMVSEQS